MSSKDKDFRLVTLVVDVCPLPLRELFLKYAKSDPGPGVPYETLDDYMLFRREDVEKIKTIRGDQLDLIYPKANEAEWDVSLLSALLLGLFGTKVRGTQESLIRTIRDVRNSLQHKPGSLPTTDEEFDETWDDIERATTSLAQIVGGQTYKTEIKKRLDETKVNNLPKLGDTLKSWYENIIRSIYETSSSSYRILDATTEKRKTNTGYVSKRMKTVDTILKKLREQFAQTFYRELPDDYNQPKEVSTIRQNLTHDHHVTICGYEKSKYLACALSIIADLDYDRSRCVEMTKPGDWRHIDPEEVDLILYHDPFSLSVTEKKRELFDVFQALMDVSTTPDDQARIDVVIVTEKSKLEENGDFKCHDIFENMVVLYEPTNEKEPVDLAKHQILYKRTQSDTVLGNMIAYSDTFIQQRRSESIDPGLLESAKEKFKRYKAVVITGPTGCGKTAFAVSLVSSIYERNQCVVLVDASEWMQVKLGEISVIIIDEFAGRFKYNAGLAESWLNRFDLIYAAVSDGKLNVIITCETARFTKVLKNFTVHPLLSHRIKLPKRGVGIVVKEEPISDNELDVNEQEQEEARNLSDVNINNDNKRPEKQEQCLLEGRLVGTLEVKEEIKYCCEAQNGKVFVFGGGNYIALLDTSNYTIIKEITLPHSADCISCIDEQNVVLFMKGENKMMYASLIDSDIRLLNSSDIPVQHRWTHLLRKGNQYVMCTDIAVFIYDLNWKRTCTVSHSNNKPLFENIQPYRRRYTDPKIRHIDVGDSIIVIGTEENIVITDTDGNIIKTFKPGGRNVTLYDDRWIFVKMGSRITIVTLTGKVAGILFEGDPTTETYRSYRVYSCFCYGKSCNKLFDSKGKSIKLLSVQ